MNYFETPALPYAGTSGWSGSDASRERAEREDNDGTTLGNQQEVQAALSAVGERGFTWSELDKHLGWFHHGRTTGALSNLHKAGRISRLKQKRGRSSIYVANEHVAGRDSVAQGRRGNGPSVSDLQAENAALRKKIAKVEELVAPKWRSYSYTRNDLIDDVRRALV